MQYLADLVLPLASVLTVLRNGKLLRLAIIPWIINIVILILAMVAFGFLDRQLMGYIGTLAGEGWWTPIITWTLGILLFLAFGAGMILSFVFIANLVGGIFFEKLSEETEYVLTGRRIPSPEGSVISILVRSTVEELKGIAFFAGIWIAMLLLYLIPGIGAVFFVTASTVWSTFTLAFEFSAPATERRGYRFRQKRKLIFAHPLRSLAFGAGLLVLTFMPLVNAIALPFAVVGGTRWLIQLEETRTGKEAQTCGSFPSS